MNETSCAQPLFRKRKRRVWELDFLRGVAVLAMCFDHLMYDLANFGGWFSNSKEINNAFMESLRVLARAYWRSTTNYVDGFRFWGHAVFIFIFLFLVGTSCAFSRDNTKRGALCAVVSFAFTGVSFVLKSMGIMRYGIVFGILQCIALSILICAAADILTSWNKRVNLYAPLAIAIIILSVAISKRAWIRMDYESEFGDAPFLNYVFGLSAYGDDWFGLFPYIGFVFLGMYWGKAAYGNHCTSSCGNIAVDLRECVPQYNIVFVSLKSPTQSHSRHLCRGFYAERQSLLPFLDGEWNKPIGFIGRHALVVYLVHQVLIAGIIILVCLSLGYELAF